MAPEAWIEPPPVPSTDVFQKDIFKGKVLFCTGGGSGICKGMVEAIMRHGAHAAILGRKLDRLTAAAQELEAATGARCLPLQADVRDPAQLRAAVARTLDAFGRIDFVICGAAGNFLAPIANLSENGFRTVIEIDTLGTYNTIKATLPHVRASKGSYIHVSATLHYRGTPYQVHVSAAKAAVDATSAVLAVEEGPHGVRSNVIAPGPIAGTEGMSRLSARPAPSPSSSSPSSAAQASGGWTTPLGRAGAVQDVANAAVFLCSGAARFVTGQVLAVDGGCEHVREMGLPYPRAVLDPEGVRGMIKPRL